MSILGESLNWGGHFKNIKFSTFLVKMVVEHPSFFKIEAQIKGFHIVAMEIMYNTHKGRYRYF